MAGQTVGRPWWLLGWAAAGLGLIVAASAIAASGRVGTVERAVFEAVNGLPDALRWPMWVFQLLGLLLIPLVVAAVALARRRIRLAIALVALVPLKLLAEKAVVKELVHRERPGTTEPNAVLRDVPSAGNSFPSGHAIIAFGIATLLTPYLGRWGRVVGVVPGRSERRRAGLPRRPQPAGRGVRRRRGHRPRLAAGVRRRHPGAAPYRGVDMTPEAIPSSIARGRPRRRPSGEAPPLPRQLNASGWGWLAAGAR